VTLHPFLCGPVDSIVASNYVAMRCYSRIKCEELELRTSALINDVCVVVLSVRKKVSLL